MNFPQEKFLYQSLAPRILVFLICVCAFTIFSFGQKTETASKDGSLSIMAAPAPVVQESNPNCADLNLSTGANEFKIDREPRSGSQTFSFTVVDPTTGVSTTQMVTVTRSGNFFNFSSTIEISAVIVKGSTRSNIYYYTPFTNGGTPNGDGLTTPLNDRGGSPEISHISFCYGEGNTGVLAGEASITGRVVRADGRGISGARISLTHAVTGETSIVNTSPFGYYIFEELEVATSYFVTIRHKRYSFADNMRTFTLNADVADLDFVANP